MLGNDASVLADHDAVGTGMNLNRAPDGAGRDRVFVVVEAHQAGLRDPMPAPRGIRRTGRHREPASVARLRTPPRPSVRPVLDAGAPWRRRCTCPAATRSTRRGF